MDSKIRAFSKSFLQSNMAKQRAYFSSEKNISLKQVDEMYMKLQTYANAEKSTSTYKDIDSPF